MTVDNGADPATRISVGLGQMNTGADKQVNLAEAERLVGELADRGAELIMLPEHFNFLGAEHQKRPNAEPLDQSPSLERMRGAARRYGIYLHIGSFFELDRDRVYNTGVVFDPDGEMLARYRKLHLFDVEVPGGKKYLESELISAGNELVTFSIGSLVFGMSTCYDLRFPELYRKLVARGAQVLLVPAAFVLETGRDHWEVLLRARAIENQCWVAAAGQWGRFLPDRLSYGRSLVVDPWGIVVAQAADGVGGLMAELDLERLRRIRTSFPVLEHIRGDLS